MRSNPPSVLLLALLLTPGAAGAQNCPADLDPLVSVTSLLADDSSLLGTSVAVGSEGRPDTANLILVGAPAATRAGEPEKAGAAFLFERSGPEWELSAPFTDSQPGTRFGWSVAVSRDGGLLAVGAPLDGEKGTSAGAVHLFERSGDGWTRLKLTGNDTTAFDAFGFSVALGRLDGRTLVVGAPLHDALEGRGNAGAVYVFERGDGGWVQTAKLTASDAERDDQLGTSVAVDILGARIAAGAPQPEPRVSGDPATGRPGKAYVFERSQSTWSPAARLAAQGGRPFDAFGFAMALAGSTVAVGAPGADVQGDTASGAVFLFERRGGSWPATRPPLEICDRKVGDELGFSLSEDNGTLVAGARRDDGRKGSVYIFQIEDGSARLTAKIDNVTEVEVGDELGRSVAVREGILVAGAPLADIAGTEDAGSAFAFGLAGLSLAQSSVILVPGTPASYKTSVTNRSSLFLNGVRVSLTFDSSRLAGIRITCSSGNQNASCCENACQVSPGGDTLVDDQVALPPGAEVTYLLEATVPPGVRGDARNEVSVLGPAGVIDPIPQDNLLFKPFPVDPRADLEVDMRAEVVGGAPAVAGTSRIRYLITATNRGPSDATRVVVTDNLPQDVRLFSRPGRNVSVQGQKVTWSLGRLSPGESATLEIEADVLPRAHGSLTNRAKVKGDEPDATAQNNAAEAASEVSVRADLKADLGFPSEAEAGGRAPAMLAVTNLGPSDALEVAATFTLPPGVEPVLPVPRRTSYDPAARELRWTIGRLEAKGSAAPVQVPLQVSPSARGRLLHVLRVAGSDPDPSPGNNETSVGLDVVARAALRLDGSVPSTVVAGKERDLLYTAEVCNDGGPSDATDVKVTLPRPEGVDLESATPPPGTSFDSASGIWSVGILPPKACATIEVTLTVLPARRGRHEWELQATAPEASPVARTLFTRAIGQADLTLSIAASPSPAVAGEKLIYRIKGENAGPSDAKRAVVTVTFSEDVDLPESLPGGVEITGQKATWTLAPAPPGLAEIEIPVQLAPGRTQPLLTTASVSADEPEPEPGNGGRQADHTALVTRVADLLTALSVDRATAQRGDPLTYSLTVKNLGPSDADLVQVEDIFPALLSGIAWTCEPVDDESGASCEGEGQVDLSTIANLPAGASVRFEIHGQVQEDPDHLLPGPLFNRVTATALDARDPDPGNDTAVSAVPLPSDSPDVSGVKVVSGHFVEGGEVVYRIVLSNNGPAEQADDPARHELTDELPRELVLRHAGALQGGGTVVVDTGGNVVHWDGTIPSHGVVEILVVAQIQPNTACTLVNNQGQISYDPSSSAMTHDPRLSGRQETCFRVEKQPAEASCDAEPKCP